MSALGVIADVSRRLGNDVASDPRLPDRELMQSEFEAMAEVAASERANIDEPFRLGIVGMFKSGKSSVINTFLGRTVLKEGRVEATAALTELRFAPQPGEERGEIVYSDGRREAMTLADALEHTDIRSAVFRDRAAEERRALQESIERVVLYVHCELLRTMMLVDTPGFGGSHTGDRKAFAALPRVDAALMIFSADRVGAKNELEIADALNLMRREIVALMNKIDDGGGQRRPEEDLAAAEAFVRQQFRTIVADGSGAALIFRYSATEVAKAFDAARNESAPPEQRAEARQRLVKWGYGGSGDGDAEKGVIAFLRERYFSSSGVSGEQRKLVAATQTLLSAMKPLLAKLDAAQAAAAAGEESAKSESSLREQRLREEINPKIEKIEAEIGDIVATLVEPFVREMEEVLVGMIEGQADLDLSDVVRVFRSQEVLAREMEVEFRSLFPTSREEQLLREAERRINRLLRNEWMYVFEELHKIDAAISLPDATQMLAQINNAVRGAVVAAGIGLAAIIASILVPGSALLWAVLFSGAELAGGHFATRQRKKIEQAIRNIKAQLRNYAEQLSGELARQAAKANDALADAARLRVRGEIGQIDVQAAAHADVADRWRSFRRDLHREYTTIEHHRLALESLG